MIAAPRTRWHLAYDIADPRRLRRVERAVSAVAERLHESLFLCDLTASELAALQARLARIIHPIQDCVRYLPLCDRDQAATRHLGASPPQPFGGGWVV